MFSDSGCQHVDLTGERAVTGGQTVGFASGSGVKILPVNVGDMGSIPGSGTFPGEGNGNPLQYCCLGNPIDRGAYSPWGCKESDLT